MFKLTKTSLLSLAMLTGSLQASDILATVNGKHVTKTDAEAFVQASAPKMHFVQLDASQKEMIVGRLIEKVLLSELAEKEGIDKQAEFVRNMNKIKSELLVNMWMKTQMDNTVVSDSEAKSFYDKNTEKFMQKSFAHARHILVKTEKEATSIIGEMKGLKEQALQEKFIELAKEKSTGPSGPKGGDLGKFAKGQMVPAFSKAVWTMAIKSITKTPIKTQFGYHVIYLEEKQDTKSVSYEDVKEKIIMSLKQQQFTSKVMEVSKELRAKATIVINDGNSSK